MSNSTIDVDVKVLLAAGAHFGHKTSRWHPKMAQYIHSKTSGTHIIDLTKTAEALEKALVAITEASSKGGQVLLVSTKKQAMDAVKATAEETGMPYVVNRWLGGMLTNQKTISGRVKHLKTLEQKMSSGELANKYNKLEVQRFQEEIDLMNLQYGGIKEMVQRPAIVFVIDVTHDKNAVNEAKKLNIPVVGLVDTNADPTGIAYPIPSNDDAVKTIQLMLDYVKQAINNGKSVAQKSADKQETK